MNVDEPLVLDDGTIIRFLHAGEGAVVGEAIRAAYGDSYDAEWVYDADECCHRLADRVLMSCIAEGPDGSLLCHCALTRSSSSAVVGESGQAVTMPQARGHHLFTHVKRHLAEWATANGMYGIFSEATTAHPFSEKANVDLGAHEAGFLLGWIPETVTNDAAEERVGRRSAALFYLKTNQGHRRPIYSPDRHRNVIEQIVAVCGLRGKVTEAADAALPDTSSVHTLVHEHHNLAILTVEEPGRDIVTLVEAERRALFDRGLDAFYVDLPLERPETEAVGEQLDQIGVTFSGVFPNVRVAGDALRLQSLNGVTISIDDISTASDHGRELLGYVIDDLASVNPAATGRPLGPPLRRGPP